LGQNDQPIINNPTTIDEADYVVLESTYGDRLHRQGLQRRSQLQAIIVETMKKGGNLVIPAFAVERTQDLLYDLNVLLAEGKLDPALDIIIDSPLAVAATEICQENIQYYDAEARASLQQGNHPLKMPNLRFSRTQQESMAINQLPGGRIIISASGMCDAGRIKHHLKHNLWRPESTVLFVGYQGEGTLGRRILEGEKIVRIHGEEVNVLADIRTIEAFSAHADQLGLLEWLKAFKIKPKQVILVHGEEKPQKVLAGLIQEQLQVPVAIPNWLDEIKIDVSLLTESRDAAAAAEEVPPAALSFAQRMQMEELYLAVQQKLHQAVISGQGDLLEKLRQIDELLQ
jgi:metallo-beta-lactamase family protein